MKKKLTRINYMETQLESIKKNIKKSLLLKKKIN